MNGIEQVSDMIHFLIHCTLNFHLHSNCATNIVILLFEKVIFLKKLQTSNNNAQVCENTFRLQ